MLRLAIALVAGVLLAVGMAACGGGNSDVSDVIPKTTPDLVAPKDTSLPDVQITAATTANTVTTPTAPAATPTPTGAGTGGTGAATGTGGGTSSGGTSTSGTGGSGGFSGFCQSNPGAC